MLGNQGLLGKPISKRGSTVPRTHVFFAGSIKSTQLPKEGGSFRSF